MPISTNSFIVCHEKYKFMCSYLPTSTSLCVVKCRQIQVYVLLCAEESKLMCVYDPTSTNLCVVMCRQIQVYV